MGKTEQQHWDPKPALPIPSYLMCSQPHQETNGSSESRRGSEKAFDTILSLDILKEIIC